MAESISIVPVDDLPPDVAINPRTGERLTVEQNYVQQKALETQIATLSKMVKAHEKVTLRAPNPLCDEIRRERKCPNSTIPNLEHYYGDTCPVGHLTRYESQMETNGLNDNMKALNFCSTLFEEAMDWWTSLPNGSIKCYADIASLFLKRFEKAKNRKRSVEHLAGVIPKEHEDLRTFLDGFNTEVRQVEPHSVKERVRHLYANTYNNDLRRKLSNE